MCIVVFGSQIVLGLVFGSLLLLAFALFLLLCLQTLVRSILVVFLLRPILRIPLNRFVSIMGIVV